MLLCLIVFASVSCNKLIDENTKGSKENDKLVDLEDKNSLEDTKDSTMERIKSMTLKEKIGQLLIVGFEGTTINEDIKKYINDYKVGGVIFFSRNIKNIDQSIKLINDIKIQNKKNNIPLFISIDEEGGRVSRLPSEFKRLPSAKIIGDIDKKEVSFEYGKIIGERLDKLGFNLDFAPVLDINSNLNNPVIGDRAFGNKTEVVTRNGIATMKGLKDKGIIAGIKHFPGHGDTEIDSHKDLPIIDKDIKALKELELVPFKNAIEEGADMIMIGHILYKDIDESYPATMSKTIIEEILRNELSFEGVVISDDMTMGAVLKNYSLEDASVKYLNSGGDILLICHGEDNPELVFKAVEDAVNSQKISEKKIDEKVYRILNLKEKYNIDDGLLKEANVEDINKGADDFLKNTVKLKE
ncbi:beta-N-acetylhexosaminidase [Tissierella sp.]|uniref:beta-N-acetylhexosaminidase n=1 Tax=Tissierella sp. TaxID=41274 RepID=UPI003F9B63A1